MLYSSIFPITGALAGRNGGHLTRNRFSKFIPRQAKHGTSEAIKSYLIEKYTSESLVRFLKERELEETVDLVEGGHIAIFRTKEEEEYARKNFDAAAAAEMDLGGVRWVESAELHEVGWSRIFIFSSG